MSGLPVCPKAASCRAPYCPMDPHRARTTTHDGEPSCHFLRHASRGGKCIPAHMQLAVREALAAVLSGAEGGCRLRKVLLKAAQREDRKAPVAA